MNYADVNVLYLAHGRAGLECLHKLLFDLGVDPANVFVLTYQRVENAELIQLCRDQQVRYATDSIKVDSTVDTLLKFGADVVVSMHFRELIPARVFDPAPLGGINLHPSLLPKFRGCFSGVWALIKGERTTGVSYHYLNDKFDDGKIVLQAELTIAADDTGHSLFNRLIDLGVSRFSEAFALVVGEQFAGLDQVGEPSYFGRALPYDGIIDPDWSDAQIDRFIRALSFPGFEGAQVETNRGRIEVNSMDEYRQLMVKS